MSQFHMWEIMAKSRRKLRSLKQQCSGFLNHITITISFLLHTICLGNIYLWILSLTFKNIYFYLSIFIVCVCLHVFKCTRCMLDTCLAKKRESDPSSTGVTGSFELPYVCWEPKQVTCKINRCA